MTTWPLPRMVSGAWRAGEPIPRTRLRSSLTWTLTLRAISLIQLTREVKENTEADQSFGDAIEAGDADSDLLIHTLSGDDADSFGIDRKNGQFEDEGGVGLRDEECVHGDNHGHRRVGRQ